MNVSIDDIDQSIRLLKELKYNLIEIEKTETNKLINLQEKIEDRYGFPRYPLSVKISVKKYFLNIYTDQIYRILTGTNDGIKVTEIGEIMRSNERRP
ncbi:MAG: hypothetical protein PHW62_01595 [Candidatus Ratteibacteria bacterium]|nr:hypothetical protein [Candidatus Ratteibacteria bacterium]